MSGDKDLAVRLRAACNGHPHAKIPWPHRILHEAADSIETLRVAHRHAAERVIVLETTILEAMNRLEANDAEDAYDMLDIALAMDRVTGRKPPEPASLWRPIATAPRDGTAIVVGRPKRPSGESYWDGTCWYAATYEPTHWQPLPSPPEPT